MACKRSAVSTVAIYFIISIYNIFSDPFQILINKIANKIAIARPLAPMRFQNVIYAIYVNNFHRSFFLTTATFADVYLKLAIILI